MATGTDHRKDVDIGDFSNADILQDVLEIPVSGNNPYPSEVVSSEMVAVVTKVRSEISDQIDFRIVGKRHNQVIEILLTSPDQEEQVFQVLSFVNHSVWRAVLPNRQALLQMKQKG